MRVAALGITDFEEMIQEKIFYVDKTYFIKKWWNSKDKITLITRPRRFGKTLTLNMVETFFSVKYTKRSELFEGLSIWSSEELKQLQGTYPVINMSLANLKSQSYKGMMIDVRLLMARLYERHSYLLDSDKLTEDAKEHYRLLKSQKATDEQYMDAVLFLSQCMCEHFEKKVLILVDEYDTPMLEAYVEGFWDEAIVFIRRMFHAALKDNPYLEKGLLTGITRITQESIFSDLNNIRVVTTTSNRYEDCFGFTEQEVFEALKEFELEDTKEEVKKWYDGFQFGEIKDIYNPWSIINYLSVKKFEPYWMNTSRNALVGKLVQEGMLDVKKEFESLIQGKTVVSEIDENITYAELAGNTRAVWSWLLTTGYIKIVSKQGEKYELALTNYEVKVAFYRIVQRWFDKAYDDYKGFQRMLLAGRLEEMQEYMDYVVGETFSFFDVGRDDNLKRKSEQFYHGFTIGLIADLHRTHIVTSNRESGFGRYDICIEPFDKSEDGIIIEFKVFDAKKEQSLEDTAKRALEQIEEKCYEADLKARGIAKVRKYGFAFKGKEVLIME